MSLAQKKKSGRTSTEESDFNFLLKKYAVNKRGVGISVEDYIIEMMGALSDTIGAGQEVIRRQEQTAWEASIDTMDKTTATGYKKMLEGYQVLLKDSGKEWIKIQGAEAPLMRKS